jgi:hypothetical protein
VLVAVGWLLFSGGDIGRFGSGWSEIWWMPIGYRVNLLAEVPVLNLRTVGKCIIWEINTGAKFFYLGPRRSQRWGKVKFIGPWGGGASRPVKFISPWPVGMYLNRHPTANCEWCCPHKRLVPAQKFCAVVRPAETTFGTAHDNDPKKTITVNENLGIFKIQRCILKSYESCMWIQQIAHVPVPLSP